MKKRFTLFGLFILFGSLMLQAAPVSRSQALEIAKKILAAQPGTKAAADIQFIWDGEDIATKSAGQPAFYVFTRTGGGFVIIAGDDNVQPVLALSDRNEFQVAGMPENVKWWMERMKAYVHATKTQAPAIRDQWSAFIATKDGAVITDVVSDKVEHLTPEWNQTDTLQGRLIYNALCPMDKDQKERHSVTGCVATAICEVLTTMSGLYAAMPASASNGPVQPYMAASGFASAADNAPYPLGETYNWTELRKLKTRADINQAITDGKEEVVANLNQLMADMGAIMHSWYSVEETESTTEEAPDTLMKYMGISQSAYHDFADRYSHPRWEAKLKAELDVRPIVYSGRSPKGGHAFVFDGYGKYQGGDVFHVNFGWGGKCNGYYYEYNLDTGSGYDFSSNCAACFNFYPDPSSKQKISYLQEGLTYTSDPPTKKGDPFSIQFVLSAKETDIGKFKIVAEDRNGNPKQVLYLQDFSKDPFVMSWYAFDDDPLIINYNIAFGDRIVCYYTENLEGDDVWKKVVAAPKAEECLEELALMPAAFIKTAASYKQNDWFELALMNTARLYDSSKWKITAPDGTVSHLSHSDSDFKLTQTGTYQIAVTLSYKMNGETVEETIVTYIDVK